MGRGRGRRDGDQRMERRNGKEEEKENGSRMHQEG